MHRLAPALVLVWSCTPATPPPTPKSRAGPPTADAACTRDDECVLYDPECCKACGLRHPPYVLLREDADRRAEEDAVRCASERCPIEECMALPPCEVEHAAACIDGRCAATASIPAGCDDCTARCGTFPPRDLVGCDAHAGEDLWTACCARVRAQTERVPSLCRAAQDCSLAPHVSPYSPDLMSACADP